MTSRTLIDNLTRALTWNAILFAWQRLGTTVLTGILFTKTDTTTFGLWATINSTIFLILLWADCGLRKSIARYMPEFINNHLSPQQWLYPAIKIQTLVLIAALPIVILSLNPILTAFNAQHDYYYYILTCTVLFMTQAYTNCMRLVFHAQFKNKWFNSRTIAVDTIEVTMSCAAVMWHQTPHIIVHLMYLKIASGAVIAGLSMYAIHKNHEREMLQSNDPIRHYNMTPFVRHSLAMWVTTILKSLSERNAITLITMYLYGPVYANGIKMAQEASLLIYRTIVKTIGTADTAFLAHVHTDQKRELSIELAVTKLTMKIIGLSVPLLGVIGFCFFHKTTIFNEPYVFHIFILMSGAYLIETMLIPYERIIEVKHNYYYLSIAYVTYIVLLACVYIPSYISITRYNTCIGPILFIALIHCVRLVSIILMVIFAHYQYNVRFPFQYALRYVALCLMLGGSFYSMSLYSYGITLLTWLESLALYCIEFIK